MPDRVGSSAPRRRARGHPGVIAFLLVAVLTCLLTLVSWDRAIAVSDSMAHGVGAAARQLCSFDRDTLGEVSGMTVSPAHPDVVWMTNDSGGGPYLYAVDLATCRIRATLHLLDTPARDHEALAAGVDERGRDVIWIGDIGDNIGGWPYARIHKVLVPERIADADVPVTTFRFRYPDRSVDAEALLAAPDREQLWVITKERGVGSIVALPSPMSDSLTPMRARTVGSARALVTDAAMSPDGSRYVVRDYLSAELFDGEPPGKSQDRFGLPLQPQGEAITWTADGSALLVASERSGSLYRIEVGGGEPSQTATDGATSGSAVRDVLPEPLADLSRGRLMALSAAAVAGVGALLWLGRRSRRGRR